MQRLRFGPADLVLNGDVEARLVLIENETADRALAAVRARTPDLPEADARVIAEAVGMASLKYADLSNDRVKDYVFSFDRMLAFARRVLLYWRLPCVPLGESSPIASAAAASCCLCFR